jgi:hypothetical protein
MYFTDGSAVVVELEGTVAEQIGQQICTKTQFLRI